MLVLMEEIFNIPKLKKNLAFGQCQVLKLFGYR